MARTLGQLAELILKRLYGGQLRTSDQKITMQQVMIHILQTRDDLVRKTLKETAKYGDTVDETFFTRYKNQDVLWDADRDWETSRVCRI